MTREEIIRRLNEVLSQNLNIREEEITLESIFKRDFGADELDLVELIIEIEEEFEIEIHDDIWEDDFQHSNLFTVGDVVSFLQEIIPPNAVSKPLPQPYTSFGSRIYEVYAGPGPFAIGSLNYNVGKEQVHRRIGSESHIITSRYVGPPKSEEKPDPKLNGAYWPLVNDE